MKQENLVTFLYSLYHQGIYLGLNQEGTLNFKIFKKIENKDQLLKEIKKKKEELISLLKKSPYDPFHLYNESFIYPLNIDYAPLSSFQLGLWFIESTSKANRTYNVPFIFRLNSHVSVDVLETALKNVVRAHESLHSLIDEQSLFQGVQKREVSLEKVNIEDKKIDAEIERELNRPFSLFRDLPIRARVFSSEKKAILTIVFHHIAVDEWSTNLFFKDLESAYLSHQNEEQVRRDIQANVQYKDYAFWQTNFLTNERIEYLSSYWNKQLLGYQPLQLKTDFSVGKKRSYEGGVVEFDLPENVTVSLKKQASELGISFYCLLLGSYYLFLKTYCGLDDIVVGCPFTARSNPQVANTIGYFINVLPLRLQVKASNSLRDFFQSCQRILIDGQEHADLPFEKIASAIETTGDLGTNPIFQTLLTLEEGESFQKESVIFTRYKHVQEFFQISRFDLSAFFSFRETKLVGGINFSIALFKRKTIENYVDTFKQVLVLVSQLEKEMPIGNFPSFTLLEKQLTGSIVKHEGITKTILDAFSDQVKENPDKIAVISKERALSFHELDQQSNRLSRYLQIASSVVPGDRVGLFLDPSENILISVLAILKIGAAYVPIDPKTPRKRLSYITENSGLKAIICDSQIPHEFQDSFTTRFLEIQRARYQSLDAELLNFSITPQSLAYVIYTSGSTGQPKGVMISHAALLNRVQWMEKEYPLDTDSVILQKTPYTFDVSVWELFWSLIKGATLVFGDPLIRKDPKALLQVISKQQITHLHFVPSLLSAFLDTIQGQLSGTLKRVFSSGEHLVSQTIDEFYKKICSAQLVNLYGPTETTVDSTYYICERNKPSRIGQPIDNTEVYVLDESLRILPRGAVGELFIGGIGLANGYINRPDLTALSFLAHPFKKGKRIYKTGDLARFDEEGNLEYFGRKDHQVKIRGLRVELGEIEEQLKTIQGVKEAVVVCSPKKTSHETLIGYYTADSKILKSSLKSQLEDFLPSYMVPQEFVFLDEFHTTSNGKLDRANLPSPSVEDSHCHIAPRNVLEIQLAEIWEEILKVNSIGIMDSFFQLGGSSIQAIYLVNQINKHLGMHVEIATLFENNTIEKLSSWIETQSDLEKDSNLMISQDIEKTLSFAQERMWFIDRYEKGTNAYNIPYAFCLILQTDISAIIQSLNAVIKRHDTLSSLIEDDGDRRFQKKISQELLIDKIECQKDELDFLLLQEASKVFDLTKEQPISCKLYFTPSHSYLGITFHHIAFDFWSEKVFFRDLKAYYDFFTGSAQKLFLPELSWQYGDFAIWQKKMIQGERLSSLLTSWKDYLLEIQPLNIPTDRLRLKEVSYHGGVYSYQINDKLTTQLIYLSRTLDTTLYTLLLGTFFLFLRGITNQNDLIIGAPVGNRQAPNVENLVGCFVNTLALRVCIDKHQALRDYFFRVGKTVIFAHANQDLPFEKLIEEMGVEKDESRHPLFQVTFEFLETDKPNNLDELLTSYTPKNPLYRSSKFDFSSYIEKTGETLKGGFVYSKALFDQETMEQYAEMFVYILNQVVSLGLNAKILDISYLNPKDYERVIYSWGTSSSPFDSQTTVDGLIENQLREKPDSIAISSAQVQMTYQELDYRASALASFLLKEFRVFPEDRIALFFNRNENPIVAILACLRIGACFVCISPSWPKKRVECILKDSRSQLILCDSKSREFFFGIDRCGAQLVSIEGHKDQAQDCFPSINPGQLAYILYTSGSTGTPKGVSISHRAVVNYIQNLEKNGLVEDSSIVDFSTQMGFDLSITSMLGSICIGAKLEIYHSDLESPEHFCRHAMQRGVSVIKQVPSYFPFLKGLLESSFLNTIILGGEKFDRAQLRDLPQSQFRIFDEYGPTETTVGACFSEIYPKRDDSIGKPYKNYQVYILNEELQPVSANAVGEIYIGGDSLARGYWNQFDLTSSRFIANPFGKGDRLFKTGDLAKWTLDGRVVFLGRADSQIKILGYRIELGEIESQMVSIPEVEEAYVVNKMNPQTGQTQLVGYYQSTKPLKDGDILDQLSLTLPRYMLPGSFLRVDAFPLSLSGKVDLKRLPEPPLQRDLVPPKDFVEKAVVAEWKKVLNLEELGVTDDFFRLGGDSIGSIQLVSKLSKLLNVQVSVKDVFEHRTVRKLCQGLNQRQNRGIKTLSEQGILTGSMNLLPIQEWFFDQKIDSLNHWNQSFLIRVPGLDTNRLQAALKDLVDYHDSFRLCFDGRKARYLVQNNPVELNFATFSQNLQDVLTKWQSGFDLANGPLYAFGYISGYKDGSARIFVAAHHVIIDVVSWKILADHIQTLYEKKNLGPKPTSYRQWAKAIEGYSAQEGEIAFWKEINTSGLEIPFENTQSRSEFTLDALTTEKLLTSVHTLYQTQINDILLSCLGLAFGRVLGTNTVSITVEGHGRESFDDSLDVNQTLGWFTSFFPLTLPCRGKAKEILKMVKELLRAVPNKGIGYGPLFGYKNLPQIVFNYLGKFESTGQRKWAVTTEKAGEPLGSSVNHSKNLVFEGAVSNGQVTFWVQGNCSKTIIDLLAQEYKKCLEEVTFYVEEEARGYLTQSDIKYVVSGETLDELQKKREIDAVFLANSLQKGLIHHFLKEGDVDDAYRIQLVWEYKTQILPDQLMEAWKKAISTFSALRLRFSWLKEIVQIIDKAKELDWRYMDLSLQEKGLEQTIQEILAEDRREGFDLLSGNLWRIYLVKLNDSCYRCIFSHHHILLDGWSVPILLNTVHSAYLSLILGRVFQGDIEDSYPKLQRYLQTHLHGHDEYFIEALSKGFDKTKLASFFQEPQRDFSEDTPRQQTSLAQMELGGKAYRDLRVFCETIGVTINAAIQLAWHKILSVFGATQKTVSGLTVSGRDLPIEDVLDAVGLCINTLPLVFDHRPEEKITDALKRIQDSIQEVSFRSTSHLSTFQKKGERIFDSIVVFENYPSEKTHESLHLEHKEAIEKVDYPMTLIAYRAEEKLVFRLFVQESWAKSDRLEILSNAFQTILAQIPSIKKKWGDIALVYEEGWNQTTYPYDQYTSLSELFANQAQATPDAIALVYEKQYLTYGALFNQVCQLSDILIKEYGISVGDRVALSLDRSYEMIIAIYAVLQAGAAYVPIDRNHPEDRKKYIIENSQARLLILSEITEQDLGDLCCPLLKIDRIAFDLEKQSNAQSFPSSLSPAYVIYTSGTTGYPKGVIVTHRSVVNRVQWMGHTFPLSEGGKILQKTPYTFDVSVWEIFWALLEGKTLVITPPDLHKEPLEIGKIIAREEVEKIHFVPSMLSAFLEQTGNKQYPQLKNTFCSGEPLPQKTIDLMESTFPKTLLANLYGPTETTVDSTYSIMKHGSKSSIGRPIDNTRVYVLDSLLNPVPPKVLGELYIAGDGLALGYLQNPSLTAERFIADPQGKGSRMYRTGDLVRFLDSGYLEYIGRVDNQVKIRGFRVELEEIETHLRKINEIKEAVVIIKEHPRTQESVLVAYLVCSQPVNNQKIRDVLSAMLPEYMVPEFFNQLEAFPKQLSGKVDRSKLPEPFFSSQDKYEEPASEEEKLIATVWSSVLGVENVSREDSFFGLGGNSILAIQAHSIFKEQYRMNVSLRGLYEYPKLRDFALNAIFTHSQNEEMQVGSFKRENRIPLSLPQQRLWFIEKLLEGSSLYHISVCTRIHGAFCMKAFKKALGYLFQRHEILRTRIEEIKGIAYQEAGDSLCPIFEFTSDSEENTQAILQPILSKPFDFENETLCRMVLIKESNDQHVFGVVFHHVIIDEWSLKVFSRELESSYQAFLVGEMPSLDPLPFQYGDYCERLRIVSAKNPFKEDLEFWKNQLAGFSGHLVPLDSPRPKEQSIRGGRVKHFLNQELHEELRKFAKENHVTLYTLFVSIFFWTLSKLSNQHDIVIGTPVSNRNSRDLEKVIGLFVNTIVLRSKLEFKDSFSKYLRDTQKLVLDALSHQHLPFEMLVDAMDVERDLSRNPLFQIMFSVEDGDQIFPKFEKTQVTPVSVRSSQVTKFDLTFFLTSTQNGVFLVIDYAKDLFHEETIEGIAKAYCQIAQKVVSFSEVRLGEIEIENKRYQERVLQNSPNKSFISPEKTVLTLIEETSSNQPDSIALIFGHRQMTYGCLYHLAKKVAKKLIQMGVGPEEICVLATPKSLEMIVGVLGIIMARGAYLPLEIDMPPQRRDYILCSSPTSIVLTLKKDAELFKDFSGNIFILDDLFSIQEDENVQLLPVHPDSLIYSVYTSGTTGTPKGVACHHIGVLTTINAINRQFSVQSSDVGILLSSLNFDLSAYDILGLLCAGGKIVIPSQDRERSFEYISDITRSNQVTIWNSVPQLASLLQDQLQYFGKNKTGSQIRLFLLSGDKIPPSLPWSLASLFGGSTVVSLGGATEGSIWSIWHVVEPSCSIPKFIPYGKAMPNQEMWVFDEHLNLCRDGVIGEILIGGSGVVRGYQGDPMKTAQAFVPSPFTPIKRLYRTGDIGRYLPSGDIEILGRKDFQVKVRGYRVELGEIESVMLEVETIEQTAVIFDGKSLIGYAVSLTDDPESLLNELHELFNRKLPFYMHPQHVIILKEVPLTSNGKIDRGALPRPQLDQKNETAEAPLGREEEGLAQIWAELLNMNDVGRIDDFFKLGGDSINAIQLVSRAREIGLKFDIKQVFATPTVKGLVAHSERIGSSPQFSRDVSGTAPLLPVQKFFLQDEVDLHHFNQGVWFCSTDDVDLTRLQKALNQIREHHESFSLRFSRAKEGWIQEYQCFEPLQIRGLEFQGFSEGFYDQICILQEEINIERGPLDLAVWISGVGLLWIIHHFIIDGVSWRILLDDLNRAYNLKSLAEPTNSYKDWGKYLTAYKPDDEDIKYYLKDNSSNFLGINSSLLSVSEGITTVSFSKELTNDFLTNIHHRFGTTPQEILLFSVLLILCNKFETHQITVALEGHGRDGLQSNLDLSRTIGWFTTLFPASFEISNPQDLENSIKEMKEQFRSIPKKGSSYGALEMQGLVDTLNTDLIFNYLGNFDLGTDKKSTFQLGSFPTGELISSNRKQFFPLEVNCLIMDGKLSVKWVHSSALSEEFVSCLSSLFEEKFLGWIQYLKSSEQINYTPSDFEAKNITQEEVDEIMLLIGDDE